MQTPHLKLEPKRRVAVSARYSGKKAEVLASVISEGVVIPTKAGMTTRFGMA